MQHIGIVKHSERGGVVAEFSGGLSSDIFYAIPESSTCLRLIEPYGDTTFDQSQLPALVAELEALQASDPSLPAKPLIAFLQSCIGDNSNVRFIGD
jgi:hypothetical protein